MGEKIKTLSNGKLFKTYIEIELNHSPLGGEEQQIHIQSEKLRLEMDKKYYLKYALSILIAEKNLKILKGLE